MIFCFVRYLRYLLNNTISFYIHQSWYMNELETWINTLEKLLLVFKWRIKWVNILKVYKIFWLHFIKYTNWTFGIWHSKQKYGPDSPLKHIRLSKRTLILHWNWFFPSNPTSNYRVFSNPETKKNGKITTILERKHRTQSRKIRNIRKTTRIKIRKHESWNPYRAVAAQCTRIINQRIFSDELHFSFIFHPASRINKNTRMIFMLIQKAIWKFQYANELFFFRAHIRRYFIAQYDENIINV